MCASTSNGCAFLLCFYSNNHRRDCFSGICFLGPVHQARNGVVNWMRTSGFTLYICVNFGYVAVEGL